MSTSTYIENMLDNLQLGIGKVWADGPQYMLYKAVNILEDLTGGINMDLQYWGLGTDFKLTDMIKAGMFGIGLIGSLASGGLMDDSRVTDLRRWG
jgi:hypothetical protein